MSDENNWKVGLLTDSAELTRDKGSVCEGKTGAAAEADEPAVFVVPFTLSNANVVSFRNRPRVPFLPIAGVEMSLPEMKTRAVSVRMSSSSSRSATLHK